MTLTITAAEYRKGARKPSKYRNKPTVIDGRRFASKKEGLRYVVLAQMERDRRIRSLATQVPVLLKIGDNRIAKYIADFYYIEGDKRVMEDAKGYQTPEFKLKWKLCQALFPEYEWRLS